MIEEEEQPRRPFVLLPFHGEHKRAISSLSFARSTSLSSYNSNDQTVKALCASASADGTARIWDVTRDSTTGELISSMTNSTTTTTTTIGTSVHNNISNKGGLSSAEGVGGSSSSSSSTESSSSSSSSRIDPTISLIGHSRGINDITWSPTSAYIATASDDKRLRLWNAETGDAYVEFRGHTNFVFTCRFNPQSNLLVSGSYDETVKLWDIRCGECVATLPAHSNPVTGVDFNRDGTMIVSGSYDGLVRIWDTATGECLKTVYAEGNPPVGGVRFSPNGRFVLTGTLDSKLRLYDLSVSSGGGGRGQTTKTPQLRGGKCAKTYAGHTNTKYCTFASFLVSSSSYLNSRRARSCVVSGSEDGKVYLYDLQSRLIQQSLEGHTDAVLAVDAHDTLELIGSGGMANDKCVRFWAPL